MAVDSEGVCGHVVPTPGGPPCAACGTGSSSHSSAPAPAPPPTPTPTPLNEQSRHKPAAPASSFEFLIASIIAESNASNAWSCFGVFPSRLPPKTSPMPPSNAIYPSSHSIVSHRFCTYLFKCQTPAPPPPRPFTPYSIFPILSHADGLHPRWFRLGEGAPTRSERGPSAPHPPPSLLAAPVPPVCASARDEITGSSYALGWDGCSACSYRCWGQR